MAIKYVVSLVDRDSANLTGYTQWHNIQQLRWSNDTSACMTDLAVSMLDHFVLLPTSAIKTDLWTWIRAKSDLGSRWHSAVTVSIPDFVTCSGSIAKQADSDNSSNNRSILHNRQSSVLQQLYHNQNMV